MLQLETVVGRKLTAAVFFIDRQNIKGAIMNPFVMIISIVVCGGIAGIPAFISIALANAMVEGKTKNVVKGFGSLWLILAWLPLTFILVGELSNRLNG